MCTIRACGACDYININIREEHWRTRFYNKTSHFQSEILNGSSLKIVFKAVNSFKKTQVYTLGFRVFLFLGVFWLTLHSGRWWYCLPAAIKQQQKRRWRRPESGVLKQENEQNMQESSTPLGPELNTPVLTHPNPKCRCYCTCFPDCGS